MGAAYHHDDDERDGTVQAAARVFGDFLARRPLNAAIYRLIASAEYGEDPDGATAFVARDAVRPTCRRKCLTPAFAILFNHIELIRRPVLYERHDQIEYSVTTRTLDTPAELMSASIMVCIKERKVL